MNDNDWRKTLGGIVLGLIGISVIAGLLFVSDLEKKRRSLIDPVSYCPFENSVKVWGFYEIFPPPVPRKIAIVIDATNHIPLKQRKEIANWFRADTDSDRSTDADSVHSTDADSVHSTDTDFVRSLDRFSRVAIYRLNESIGDQAPEFEKCAPPSEANPYIENPRIVKQVFEEKFLGKLSEVVKSLAAGSEKQRSPIMEMAEKVFDSYDEMIIVSDLMHHTDGYSLYNTATGKHHYGDFINTPYATTISKNRNGKTLKVIYIIRKWKTINRQNTTLRRFWEQHMTSNGGEFLLAKMLSTIAN